ncbi:PH domain-containing protein [Streptomyces niveiscabiei]|uniref:PH domain-containing protein n=1 Tax=Streptomyces TaxID=1883 RepID=UPI00131BF8D6|nr:MULTISPECIES: PH domain-containing protein [Streptomyces]
MTARSGEVALRRRSWIVLCWIMILGLGIGTVGAIARVTAVHGFRTGWQGIPVFLVTATVIGRISNSKVILSGDVLTVVNPLRSHVIPRSAIRGVEVDAGGTLVVRLDGEREVGVYAFGGSLVDRVRDTSGEAARRIDGWLRAGGGDGGVDAVGARVQWTRCPSADVSLALCVLTVGVGAGWMVFTSG